MNVREYFQSLSQEIGALKHRVRHLIEDAHWQTDGEWKETVVRQVLRRHLSSTDLAGTEEARTILARSTTGWIGCRPRKPRRSSSCSCGSISADQRGAAVTASVQNSAALARSGGL